MNKSDRNSEQPVVLEVRDVVKEFPSGNRTLRVLDGVNIQVREQEFVSIAGPSGVGKTTLLHVLGLIDRPTEGSIRVRDTQTENLGEAMRSQLRNTSFGFVYQFYHLIPELTALENVLVPGMIATSVFRWFFQKSSYHQRAKDLLDEVGLSDRLHHTPSELSGGERQRVAIARALLLQPEVMICDEPTGNLDTKTGQKIFELLKRMREEHRTALIIATHDHQLAAKANRGLAIRDGELHEMGEVVEEVS